MQHIPPHHAVQDAISSVSTGKGITINIKQSIHSNTGSYKSVITGLNSSRQHLAADIAELRVLLKNEGYSRSEINAHLYELIKQNKALGDLRNDNKDRGNFFFTGTPTDAQR